MADLNTLHSEELHEEFREYEWFDPAGGSSKQRFDKPIRVYFAGETHIVLGTDGVYTEVPAVGYFGCVVRWK